MASAADKRKTRYCSRCRTKIAPEEGKLVGKQFLCKECRK